MRRINLVLKQIKSNLDCNHTFPIELAQNVIQFADAHNIKFVVLRKLSSVFSALIKPAAQKLNSMSTPKKSISIIKLN